ncbi:uncharacterized protein KD926_005676 [Aspergillus affinis]|uniref:uncharacterized protein n=1 Tax=Aspergillus affinis TaxID=1070780 RepID=UPI0022FEF1D9|nr:uncharacterized protein KD926_005676 [Aspergillus affinis]KAI9042380.1 hypothetical protein KD926_005676 [Aspergillus affinis]
MDELHSALLRRGISYLNDRDENGLTPLHYAVQSKERNAATTANRFIKLGANLTISDGRDCTPYMLASLLGQTEVKQVLAQALENEGKDLESDSSTAKQLRDLPALYLAEHGHWPTLYDLIINSKEIRPDLAHRKIVTGQTLLHLAITAKQFNVLCSLLRSTSQSSDSQSTSFRIFVCNGNVDTDGFTLLQRALRMKSKCSDIAELLLKYHDDSCDCGIRHAGIDPTDVDDDTGPSLPSTLKENAIGSDSHEKHSLAETRVSFGVGIKRRLFNARSLLMVLVLALSMSSTWVGPWDGRGPGQGKDNEDL